MYKNTDVKWKCYYVSIYRKTLMLLLIYTDIMEQRRWVVRDWTYTEMKIIALDLSNGAEPRIEGPDADELRKEFEVDMKWCEENGKEYAIPFEVCHDSKDDEDVLKSIGYTFQKGKWVLGKC